MPKNPVKPRPSGSLEDAVTRLVVANGGFQRAAVMTRVSDTQLLRYSDPTMPDSHAPIDIVRALETACDDPIVTEALAAAAGCVLLRLDGGADDRETLHRDVAAIGERISAVFAQYAEAMANDGAVDRREAGRMLSEVDRALRALMHVRGHLYEIARPDDGE